MGGEPTFPPVAACAGVVFTSRRAWSAFPSPAPGSVSNLSPGYWSCPGARSRFPETVAFLSQPLWLGTEGQLNLLMLLEPVTLFLNEGLEKSLFIITQDS